jgi:hypothetical protein
MKQLAHRCIPKIRSLMFNLRRTGLHDEVSSTKFICKYGSSLFDKRIWAGCQCQQFIVSLGRIKLDEGIEFHTAKLGWTVPRCQESNLIAAHRMAKPGHFTQKTVNENLPT